MTEPVNVAVVGATGAVGGAIVELLAERQFPLNELFLLASDRSAGTSVMFKNRKIVVHELAQFDFSQVQLAFFAVPEAVAAEVVPRATAAGCTVIDSSAHFRDTEDAALVLPHRGEAPALTLPASRIFASPHPAAGFLSQALDPLLTLIDIKQVNTVIHHSVSIFGKAAVEALGSQAVALLNMREPPTDTLPFQVAFNLSPLPDSRDADGYTRDEKQVIVETKKILGRADMDINAMAALAPVFYGIGMVVQITTNSDPDLDRVKAAWSKAPALELCVEDTKIPYPNALKHGSGTDFVYIGNVRQGPSGSHGLSFWIFADNIRTGGAANSVYIGESLVKGVL